MRRFAVDGEARDFHRAVTIFPWPSALARYLCAADKFDRLYFARGRQDVIADPKLFNIDFAFGGLIRVPGRKQRLQVDVTHGPVPPRVVCADALRPAKPNPNPSAAPAHSFQPAIKLRREVATVAFPSVEASKKLLSSPISKSPNSQGNQEHATIVSPPTLRRCNCAVTTWPVDA